jgi:hypothetical protein
MSDVIRFPKNNEPREYWVQMTPIDSEMVHIWVHRGVEYAITKSRRTLDHWNHTVFIPTRPPGLSWERTDNVPAFLKSELDPNKSLGRPKALWARRAERR